MKLLCGSHLAIAVPKNRHECMHISSYYEFQFQCLLLKRGMENETKSGTEQKTNSLISI